MTNAELIAKIKAEIESRKEAIISCPENGIVTLEVKSAIRSMSKELLSVISDLESEKPMQEGLDEAAENLYPNPDVKRGTSVFANEEWTEAEKLRCAFKAGAEWMARQGWTFDAHKGTFGICFDKSIDGLLDELQDREKVIVQIRKKDV